MTAVLILREPGVVTKGRQWFRLAGMAKRLDQGWMLIDGCDDESDNDNKCEHLL